MRHTDGAAPALGRVSACLVRVGHKWGWSGRVGIADVHTTASSSLAISSKVTLISTCLTTCPRLARLWPELALG